MPKRYRDMTIQQQERHKANVRAWQQRNPEKVKRYQQVSRRDVKWNYDNNKGAAFLTREQYNYEVIIQNRRCLICSKKPKRLHTCLHPVEEKFMGLLCRQCLGGLERFDFSRTSLIAAANFVIKALNHHTNPASRVDEWSKSVEG